MSGQFLSCLVSLHPKLEAKHRSTETALLFSFPFYTNYALLWCLHLSLVGVCAVFLRKMLLSELGGAFGNVFVLAQERQERNYLCEMEGVGFFCLIWMNEEKGGKENNSFLLIL